jgi:PKD repeat protein
MRPWPRAAAFGLVAVLLGATFPSSHGSPFLKPGSSELNPPLNVTATFVDWMWTGLGTPCSNLGGGTFVAHFAGNATGGFAPYRFSWNFGDTSRSSSLQNPSHVFQTSDPWEGRWNVTLTVTDASGAISTNMTRVWVPITSCPSGTSPFLPVIVLGIALVAIIGVAVGIHRKRVRERTAESRSALLFCSLRALHNIGPGLVLTPVPHLGGKPHLETLLQSVLGSGREPIEVQFLDADGVAVKVLLDDLELSVDDFRVEVGPPITPQHHAPYVVTDSLTPHPPSVRSARSSRSPFEGEHPS